MNKIPINSLTMERFVRICLILLFTMAGALSASAAPLTFTYQGRIIGANGPLEYQSVSFEFSVTNPDGSCILYREQKNGVDMRNSKGVFDTPIGAGTKMFPSSPTFNLLSAFVNSGTLDCEGGGTYSPSVDDVRKLRVQFFDGAGWKLISPDNIIRSVPFAGYAQNATTSAKLGTNTAADFLLKGSIPVCVGTDVLTSNASGVLTCVAQTGSGGGGTVTGVTSANNYLTVTNSTTAPVLTVNVGTVANTVAAGNDARFTDARTPTGSAGGDLSGTYPNPTVAKLQGRAVDNGAPSTGQVLLWDGTSWKPDNVRMQDVRNSWGGTAMIPSTTCAVNEAMVWSVITDRFTCQAIALDASAITAGTIAAARFGNNVAHVAALPAGGQDGQSLRWNNTAGNWEWFTAGAAGSGIATINGLNGNAQTLAPTSSATSYGFNSAGSSHTLVIPSAGTAGVTAGTISKTEYDTFNAKQAAGNYITTLSGDVTSSGFASGTVTTTIANNAVTTAKINDGAVTTSKIPDGNVTGAKLEDVTGLVAGTYPKVTVDAKGRVTSGTTLVATDIPNLDAAKITSGVLNTARLGSGTADNTTYLRGDGTWAATPTVTETDPKVGANTTNYLSKWNGSALVASGVFENSGNVGIGTASPSAKLHIFDATASMLRIDRSDTPTKYGYLDYSSTLFKIGTSGADGIRLYTNGSNRMTVGATGDFDVNSGQLFVQQSTGNLGIGTATPNDKLEVAGKIRATHICATDGTNCKDLTTSWSSGGTGDFKADGTVAMTGAFRAAAGNSTTPSITFAGDTGTGFYSVATNTMGFISNSVERYRFGVSSIASQTNSAALVSMSGVSANNPTYTFVNDSDTGMYHSATDTVALSAGGVRGFEVNPTTSAVNYIAVTPAVTGSSPVISSAGSDTNVNLTLTPKGTGNSIFSSGNVGIGTASPSAKLEVSAADSNTQIRVVNTTSSATRGPNVSIRNYVNGNGGAPYLELMNSGGTQASPTAVVNNQTLGTVGFQGGYDTSGGYGSGGSIIVAAEGNFTNTSSPGRMIFKTTGSGSTSATERMRIDSNGNVGINTTSPSAKLNVVDDSGAATVRLQNTAAAFSASIGFRDESGNNKGYLEWGNSTYPGVGGSSSLSLFTYSTDPLALGTNGTDRLHITGAGNIGIGTATPGDLLSVAGKIRATHICAADGTNCKDLTSSWGAGGSVTSVATGTGLTGGAITTSGTISIAAGGVSATELASNAVTTAKILDGNVTGAKLEDVAGLTAGSYGSATAVPAITVDAKGRVTAVTSTAITGLLPTASGVSGKYLKSDGTNWAGADIKFSDIKNGTGTSAFNTGSCAANQTVKWSSLTDMFECQNIGSIDASAITTGTIDVARLPASVLQWQDGGSNKIYYSAGNVGIGVASPTATFEVKSATANALSVGLNGATNPAFNVDASTASSATGVNITSVATGGTGPIIASISSAANENLNIASKGTGTVNLRPAGTTRYTFGASSLSLKPVADSTAATNHFLFQNDADTGLTASTEATSVYFDLATNSRTHANGAITTQRDYRIAPTTHSFASGSNTITDAMGLSIDGPPKAGSNATITNSHGLYIGTYAVNSPGTVTNGYGLTVNAPTGAATKNWAAQFLGGHVKINSDDPFIMMYDNSNVRTSPNMTGGMYIYDSSNNAAGFLSFETGDSNTDLYLGVNTAGGNGGLRFNTAGSTRAYIDYTGKMGIGTATPQTNLEVSGALRLSSTTTDSFTTPTGATVQTKINVPIYDPGAYGQVFAMGVPSTATSTARVMSALDGRTSAHQPTLAVFSPDENNIVGLNFNGSNAVGYLQSTTSLGFMANSAEVMRIVGTYVGVGVTAPWSPITVQSQGNTPTISVYRANNANAAMVSYEPNGASSAGNPVWYTGMAGSSSDFQLTSWDGATVSNHITVLTGGNIGIGKTNPSYKLDVQGDINSTGGSVRASGVALTSDIRFKKDIEPLEHALDRILNLRGVSYNWRKDEFPNKNFNDRHQVGVIAQDVEKQFPELVDEGKDGYKSVNYPALVAPVIEAIRELYNKYMSQEVKLAQQQKQIDDLQKTVKGLRDIACAKDPKSEICQ